MPKLPSRVDRPELAEQEPDPWQIEPPIGVCYYRKALHLQSIAEELLADSRAKDNADVKQTTDKLMQLVEAIKTDNADCWTHGGSCPRCPETLAKQHPNFSKGG